MLAALSCQIITMCAYASRRGRRTTMKVPTHIKMRAYVSPRGSHTTMKPRSRRVVPIKCHDGTPNESSSPPLVLIGDNDIDLTKVSAH